MRSVIALMPVIVWVDSAARFGSAWLSPPKGKWTAMTGVTFIKMSAMAAVI